MKCSAHHHADAVGTCNACGKGLCHECVEVFTPPLCEGCATAHNRQVASSLTVQLLWIGGAFIAALVLLHGRLPWPQTVGWALVAAFFLPGWNFLGRYFSPDGGYLFAGARWMNLSLHAFLAAMIGVIVGPIYLFKAWKEFRTIRQTRLDLMKP